MSTAFLEISDLPLCLGPMDTPHNPAGLPDVTPFRLEVNNQLGRLEQAQDSALDGVLKRGYQLGIEMGTPSDSTELGRPYVDDFVRFIQSCGPTRGSLLEIGAGTGFLSKCLIDAGWKVTSLEPGKGYQARWDHHGVNVINDFYPSQRVTGQFDAIIFYTVLEHIKDTKTFLEGVKSQLRPGGQIYLSVPDCSEEIVSCDPSILLHEHFQYFTKESLVSTLAEAGFRATVEVGKFGRSLYAAGTVAGSDRDLKVCPGDTTGLDLYISGVVKIRDALTNKVEDWLARGNVGIYCPARMLNCIPPSKGLLFYDDASALQGKYYPPFLEPISDRNTLLQDPPPTLLIASRTFGEKIKGQLIAAGLKSKIILLTELI